MKFMKLATGLFGTVAYGVVLANSSVSVLSDNITVKNPMVSEVSSAVSDCLNDSSYISINTVQKFLEINNRHGKYCITSDIDFSKGGYPKDKALIDKFSGELRAGINPATKKRFKLSNITLDASQKSNLAVIGTLAKKAKVLYLHVDNINIKGKDYLAGLVVRQEAGSGLWNTTVTGRIQGSENYMGGLVARQKSEAMIDGSSATVDIKQGAFYIGGLVGYQEFGATINHSSAHGHLSVRGAAGGLVGIQSQGDRGFGGRKIPGGYIGNSYATGSVRTMGGNGGGLVGVQGYTAQGDHPFNSRASNVSSVMLEPAMIEQSYATGIVTGGFASESTVVGGLVGYQYNGKIYQSYATGTVKGTSGVGGLVGESYRGEIIDSYAMGAVVAVEVNAGGLVGLVSFGPLIIKDNYAMGKVSGSSRIGGLVGGGYFDHVKCNDNYWDVETSTVSSADSCGTGKTTVEMKSRKTFKGWDYRRVWREIANDYPDLQNNSRS